jgi:hypothetical protein
MKQFSAIAALVAALAISTSAFAIDVSFGGGGSAGGGAGASANTPAGNVGVTGSVNVGGAAGAGASVNPGNPAGGVGAGATASATGGARAAATSNQPSCVAFNTTLATSDAEIAAIKALGGNAKVVVYQLDATNCPQVRNVTTADVGKLQAAINANAQLVTDLKAKKIEVGNVVAASVASDGTVSLYTQA